MAKIDLFKAYHQKDVVHKAKNVILFLGDGMGISTLTPSRILKGQLKNATGEEDKLVFEDFPNTCLIKVSAFHYKTLQISINFMFEAIVLVKSQAFEQEYIVFLIKFSYFHLQSIIKELEF